MQWNESDWCGGSRLEINLMCSKVAFLKQGCGPSSAAATHEGFGTKNGSDWKTRAVGNQGSSQMQNVHCLSV